MVTPLDPLSRRARALSRLTPLEEVFGLLQSIVAPVPSRDVALSHAAGCIAAADLAVTIRRPPTPIALRDGWAVRADIVADAGPYAPVALADPPLWIEAGQALPAAADAVLPPDALALRGAGAEVLTSVGPGEGVIGAGIDVEPGQILRRAGESIRAIDAAVLQYAGLKVVPVRQPRLRLLGISNGDHPVAGVIAAAAICRGASCVTAVAADQTAEDQFSRVCAADDADAVIVISGPGARARDRVLDVISRAGRLDVHGIGLVPGEATAIGSVGRLPVIVLPSLFDAALAAWLVVGRHLLTRLANAAADRKQPPAPLLRKVVSGLGLAEVVPVRYARSDSPVVDGAKGGIEPLASGHFPLHVLATADGWILVSPESEGYPAGSMVVMETFS
jgi:molybdopterin molybdotransferase